MLDDVVHRQVDKAKVGLLVRLHQPLAKVVYGGKPLVIVIDCEIIPIENGIAFHKAGHVKAHEELRVDLVHFLLEEPLEKVEPPATTHIATALTTMNARFRGRLRAVKEPAAPRGLLFEVKEPAVLIDHTPAN